MTTTPTTELAGLLSAKKAELNGPPADANGGAYSEPADYLPPATTDMGEIIPPAGAEIVPAAAVEPRSSLANGDAPAAPAPIETATVFPVVPPKVLGGIPYARDYVKLSKTICNTEMVPASVRGRYDAITATFLRGYEMGFAPMQSLDSFNVIQGSVGLKPEAMRALIFDNGHEIILGEEYGEDGAIVAIVAECKRKGWDRPRSYRYSMDDARQMGLLGKDNWKKMPRAMLEARATAGAGRRYFADILAGMSYTPEEIRDFSGPEQEAPPSQPPPPPAPAPEVSSGSAPESSPAAESTGSASATSPEESADSAPPTPSTPPKRPRGRPRKADASATPPASSDAPSAPAPEAPTPLSAADAAPPETTSLNSPGEAGVRVQMAGALVEILKGLPTVQQPLCRAFIQQHFPGRKASELTDTELDKAIAIAAGWPESADQHPIPNAGQQEIPF